MRYIIQIKKNRMKNIKTFRKVRASIINEKLKAKKPNDKITIDVDLDYNPDSNEQQDRDSEKIFKKFKLTVDHNGATPVSFDMSGKKQDIINYLQSKYYSFDDEDIRDLYPELLEGSRSGRKEMEEYIIAMEDEIPGSLHSAISDEIKVNDWSKGIKKLKDDHIQSIYDDMIDARNNESVKEGMFDKFKKRGPSLDEPAWFEAIANQALANLKKHHKWKDMELAAMGPGNKKNYMDMAITTSKHNRGAEYEFKVHFDNNDKVTKIENVTPEWR